MISAGLAILSALGLLMYCGMPFVDLVAAAPFLALGIGVDDMFVMLAAWRKTDHYLDTEARMAEAFSEAAMSITITSGQYDIFHGSFKHILRKCFNYPTSARESLFAASMVKLVECWT